MDMPISKHLADKPIKDSKKNEVYENEHFLYGYELQVIVFAIFGSERSG